MLSKPSCFALPSLVLALISVLQAQDQPRLHYVRASGEASVSAKPDRAEIAIGVTTHAVTAEEASAQNATQSTQVQDAIKQVLGGSGQMKTSGYSLSPQYDNSNGHKPRLNGYDAYNTVTVTVDQLSRLPKVIDAATATGATNINGVSFTLKDATAVRAKALAEAATQARSNAEVIAKALGVQVIGLIGAEPSELPQARPMFSMAQPMPMMRKTATPIEAGDLDIRATVTVTLEIRQ